MDRTTITLTFCECGENHVGNQQIGEKIGNGISAAQVRNLAQTIEQSEIIFCVFKYDLNIRGVFLIKYNFHSRCTIQNV